MAAAVLAEQPAEVRAAARAATAATVATAVLRQTPTGSPAPGVAAAVVARPGRFTVLVAVEVESDSTAKAKMVWEADRRKADTAASAAVVEPGARWASLAAQAVPGAYTVAAAAHLDSLAGHSQAEQVLSESSGEPVAYFR